MLRGIALDGPVGRDEGSAALGRENAARAAGPPVAVAAEKAVGGFALATEDLGTPAADAANGTLVMSSMLTSPTRLAGPPVVVFPPEEERAAVPDAPPFPGLHPELPGERSDADGDWTWSFPPCVWSGSISQFTGP